MVVSILNLSDGLNVIIINFKVHFIFLYKITKYGMEFRNKSLKSIHINKIYVRIFRFYKQVELKL